jgi:hypothetical protein
VANTDAVDWIRQTTNAGRPYVRVAFLARLETLLGRALRPQERGRKPKTSATLTPNGRSIASAGAKEAAN